MNDLEPAEEAHHILSHDPDGTVVGDDRILDAGALCRRD
jgi:hypothetical protein